MDWILCSEKQPKHYQSVVLCMRDKRHGHENDFYYISARYINGEYVAEFNVDVNRFLLLPYAWTPTFKPTV